MNNNLDKKIYTITTFKSLAKIGGVEKYLQEIYNNFSEFKYIEISHFIKKQESFEENKNIKYITSFFFSLKINKELKNIKNKTIIFNLPLMSLMFIRKKNIKNNNFIYVDHGDPYKKFFLYKNSDSFILNKIFYSFLFYFFKPFIKNKIKDSLLVTYTKYDIQEFEKFCSFKDKKIIPLFSNHYFNIEYLNFEERKYDLLFVGRFDKIKRVKTLIKESINYDLSLALAGSGKQNKVVNQLISNKNKIKNYGLANEEQKNYLFSNSKYFIHLSKFEGFGFSIVEAMKTGLPIILLDTFPAAKFLVGENNERGFLAKNDIEAFEWIKKNINNQNLWKEKSTSAKNFVEENLTKDEFLNKWKKILNS